MAEQDRRQPQTEPGQQEPTPTSQAQADGELSDEALENVAGGVWTIPISTSRPPGGGSDSGNTGSSGGTQTA
jgi:hypothetical protein